MKEKYVSPKFEIILFSSQKDILASINNGASDVDAGIWGVDPDDEII